MELTEDVFIFYLAIGVIFIIIAIGIKIRNIIATSVYKKKIIGYVTMKEIGNWDKYNEDRRVCYYSYKFKIDGKQYVGRSKYPIYQYKYNIGAKVKIYYNPNDPTDIYNKGDLLIEKLPILLSIVGIFLVVYNIVQLSKL